MENDRQWSNTLRYMALTALAIFIVLAVYLSRSSIKLILSAAVIAYVLSPLVNFQVEKLHFKRGFAVLISYLLLVVILVLLLVLVAPQITQAIQNFMNTDWPTTLDSIDQWLAEAIRNLEVNKPGLGGVLIDLTVPLTELRNTIGDLEISTFDVASLTPDFASVWQSIVSVGANLVSTVLGVILAAITTIMASIHFCRDGWKLGPFLVSIFPQVYQPEIRELISRLGRVWNNYFVGQIKLMLFIGVGTFLITSSLGMKWAPLLGIIAGFLEVIPNIGPIIAAIPAILSAAIFGSSWIEVDRLVLILIVVAAYILIQQLENVIVVPRIMGKAMELHPVLIILGVLILSSRIGILGALLASPILGIMKVSLHYIISKIKKEDPYPELFADPQ